MDVEEFKAEIKRRNWREPYVTEPCCLCGGNEWRFTSAEVFLGRLCIATSCAVCPSPGGMVGPVCVEEAW